MKLMYITNDPVIAKVAEESDVDWIFIDLEILGKDDRQGHLDTVISRHSEEDIPKVKEVLTKSKLLVRIDPINPNSKKQIETVIEYGADLIMLPFFKNSDEVSEFINYVDGRVETVLLLETPKSVDDLDNILEVKGIDYIHVGLNDLHLGYNLKFMFELLSNGTVEKVIGKIKQANIKYGFGGLARLGEGDLKAEYILTEHYRLKSQTVILGRTFLNTKKTDDIDVIKKTFHEGVKDIRDYENKVKKYSDEQFVENKQHIDELVEEILKRK